VTTQDLPGRAGEGWLTREGGPGPRSTSGCRVLRCPCSVFGLLRVKDDNFHPQILHPHMSSMRAFCDLLSECMNTLRWQHQCRKTDFQKSRQVFGLSRICPQDTEPPPTRQPAASRCALMNLALVWTMPMDPRIAGRGRPDRCSGRGD
jgi:hypothetical protein